MTAKHERHLSMLLRVAETSSLRAKLAAAIIIKNEVISVGMNQYKTHPLQAKFGKNPKALYIHAEIDAISRAIRNVGLEKVKGSSLYIARAKFSRDGQWIKGLAKPCIGCANAIAAFGIKKVFWTDDEDIDYALQSRGLSNSCQEHV